MSSTFHSVFTPNMFPQQQQQYQVVYNQCLTLKKDYDAATDPTYKDALRVVLNNKVLQLQGLMSSYTSTINTQLQNVTPQ